MIIKRTFKILAINTAFAEKIWEIIEIFLQHLAHFLQHLVFSFLGTLGILFNEIESILSMLVKGNIR